jgi:hypothetical protein
MLRTLVLTLLALFALSAASAQNVASLLITPYTLPQAYPDAELLTLFFDALEATQVPCPVDMVKSLEQQEAQAACATVGISDRFARPFVESAFNSPRMELDVRWLTPWQTNNDFGIVRQAEIEGVLYFLAYDLDPRRAYVIRFD